MPDKSQEVGVIFPTAGLDVTCEFGRQPPDTAASGVNVRTSDPFLARDRGGSRPGLSQRIAHAVVEDGVEVQHINVLVDPQSVALTANYSTPNPVLDPSTNNLSQRNPGRMIEDGGDGVQLNRNVPDPDEGSIPNIQFVSKYRVSFGVVNAGVVNEITLPATPTNQNTLIVIVQTGDSNLVSVEGPAVESVVTACTNAGLNDYNQAGGNGYTSSVRHYPLAESGTGGTDIESVNSMSVFWKQANAGATDATVRVTISERATLEVTVLEYRGCSTTNPVSDVDRESSNVASEVWPVEQIPTNNTTGQMLVAAFTKINTTVDSVSDGWTSRYGVTGTDGAEMVVCDRGTVSGATPVDVTAIVRPPVLPSFPSARSYAGIAVALTR